MRHVRALPVASQLRELSTWMIWMVNVLESEKLLVELSRLAALLAELAVMASDAADELRQELGVIKEP